MKMRKIIAIVAAVLMLCSILPITAMAADAETIKYTISSYPAGTQYKAETHKLDDYLTVITNTRCHFTTELRIYAPSGSVNGEVILASTREMTAVVLNAGNKASTLTVSTSPDNSTWTQHSTLSVASSYKDLSIANLPAGTKYVKLVNGSGQVRVKYITVSYAADAPAGGDEPTCEHENAEYDYDCQPGYCPDCETELPALADHSHEEEITAEPTCTEAGEKTLTCACGDEKTEAIQALGHNYVEGFCSACGAEEPNTAEYTITFDADKTQRTEFSTTKQVWKNGPLTFTNNKGGAQSNVADYGAPVRLYKGSEIVVECIGMTQIVFDCNSTTYATTLKNSIGDAATANGDKVTVTVSDNTLTATLSDQVRIDSMTVTAEVEDAETCEHTDAKACDAYCPKCGELINEGATCVSDAQYPCYAGVCIHCGDAIAAVDHVLDDNDVCTVCGLAPTPEKPVDPENPQKYVFADFAAGTQYAENEKHFLDNAVTVITSQAHFTEELRIYSSTTNNSTVVIKSKKDISAIVLNAGNKADVLNVYISEDGEVYSAIEVTKTTYNDYTLLIPEMTKYIKLDVAGDQQIRVKAMTLYFDGEVPHTCEFNGTETKAPTCTEDGVMTYSCECGEGTYTEAIPATGHAYADDYDAYCETCGEVRVTDAEVVTSFGGNSVSEDVAGLAFKFDIVANVAIAFERISEIDYAESTIGGYQLVKMGAVVANKGGATVLDNVGDGQGNVIDIPAVYLCNKLDNSASFAVRVIEIPEAYFDREITARPYFIYEDAEGNEITIYGEEKAASYNGVLNG